MFIFVYIYNLPLKNNNSKTLLINNVSTFLGLFGNYSNHVGTLAVLPLGQPYLELQSYLDLLRSLPKG